MSHILGVKFKDYGQTYHFDSGAFVVAPGDAVLVETEQGLGLGRVVDISEDVPQDVDPNGLKPIFKVADEEDVKAAQENEDLARQAFRFCKARVRERGLDMKLVDVEVFFDRSKMIFYFTAPGRIDFRELVKDLVREYRTRIELRQIGVRHETQMLGAVGNCGQVCCCRRFLRKFEPVTIKMAKEQNLFLNPAKISGICGRLLCCLAYEQKNYEQFQKLCPKTGKKFQTTQGTVKVLRTNFFRQSVTILPEIGEEQELSVEDWARITGKISDKEPGAAPAQPEAEPRGAAPAGNEEAPQDIEEDMPEAEEAGVPQTTNEAPEARKGKPRRRRKRRPKAKGSDQAD